MVFHTTVRLDELGDAWHARPSEADVLKGAVFTYQLSYAGAQTTATILIERLNGYGPGDKIATELLKDIEQFLTQHLRDQTTWVAQHFQPTANAVIVQEIDMTASNNASNSADRDAAADAAFNAAVEAEIERRQADAKKAAGTAFKGVGAQEAPTAAEPIGALTRFWRHTGKDALKFLGAGLAVATVAAGATVASARLGR